MTNQRVHFRISDACIPEPHEILLELFGKEILQGEVIEEFDSHEDGESFVAVKVEGIQQIVIVPVKKILRTRGTEEGPSPLGGKIIV